jgi:hypothetical protein
MIRLPAALAAWGGPDFKTALKRELEGLDPGALPLQQAVSTTSYALDERITAIVLATEAEPGVIRAKVGVFFSGLVPGCSCADDPTPIEPQNQSCELGLAIDRETAAVAVTVLEDE